MITSPVQANHDDEYRNVVVQFNKQLRSHPRYQQLMDLILTKVGPATVWNLGRYEPCMVDHSTVIKPACP